MSLKEAIAKIIRNRDEFTFTIFGPVSEVTFIAPSYSSMIHWVAVINSISSNISGDFDMTSHIGGESYYSLIMIDMPLEIFEKEYHAVIANMENSEFSIPNEDSFFEKCLQTETDENTIPWVLVSDLEAIKYDTNAATLKMSSSLVGITLDKLIEKITDVYYFGNLSGTYFSNELDDAFLNLIIYSFRCFADSKIMLSKLMSRMLSSADVNDGWAPIIKLRYFLFHSFLNLSIESFHL